MHFLHLVLMNYEILEVLNIQYQIYVKATLILVITICREYWWKCRPCNNAGNWPDRNAAMGHETINRTRKPNDLCRESP